jgi:hypothetical protein
MLLDLNGCSASAHGCQSWLSTPTRATVSSLDQTCCRSRDRLLHALSTPLQSRLRASRLLGVKASLTSRYCSLGAWMLGRNLIEMPLGRVSLTQLGRTRGPGLGTRFCRKSVSSVRAVSWDRA